MKLKGDNEAKDIQLKLSRLVIVQYTCHLLHFSMSLSPLSLSLSPSFRKSLENQMNECTSLKDRLREYVSRFSYRLLHWDFRYPLLPYSRVIFMGLIIHGLIKAIQIF